MCRIGKSGYQLRTLAPTEMEQLMKFGYFDDTRREYVITRPDTPLPWINYLGCEAYFGRSRTLPAAIPFIRMPVCAA